MLIPLVLVWDVNASAHELSVANLVRDCTTIRLTAKLVEARVALNRLDRTVGVVAKEHPDVSDA